MQIKLIIWDLDDTLWRGTLADGDTVSLYAQRAELIRDFNARGIVSSLCSKNDRAAAQAMLETLGLWDQFVFPHIAFTPKAESVAQIIADMQLRPANVLFVDDNRLNLEAVRHSLPDIHILDAASAEADAVLEALLAAAPRNGRNRIAEYRMLEAKAQDRAASDSSNEDFLRQCGINASAPFIMDNLDFVERIAELVNRSNQLNYTGSRFDVDTLTKAIIDVPHNDTWSIFAWDRYGDHGLVGFVMVDRDAKKLTHFAFSCRVMHMGLENYALARVREKWPDCDISVLNDRVPDITADWITDRPFSEPETRARLIRQMQPTLGGAKDIRLMFDCQSGGIAHFSRLRDRMDFDNSPRVFSLCHVLTDPPGVDAFAPNLIYGAGVDYSDPRWPDLADLIEGDGLLEACAHLLCERVAAEGRRMLVILPTEDAPEHLYRPHMGHTRARTIQFNAHWRAAAGLYPNNIDLFEMTGFIRPDEMSDVSHYHAGFLQRLAEVIDNWVGQGVTPVVAAPRRLVMLR